MSNETKHLEAQIASLQTTVDALTAAQGHRPAVTGSDLEHLDQRHKAQSAANTELSVEIRKLAKRQDAIDRRFSNEGLARWLAESIEPMVSAIKDARDHSDTNARKVKLDVEERTAAAITAAQKAKTWTEAAAVVSAQNIRDWVKGIS